MKRGPLVRIGALAAAGLVGVMVAAQARINGELGRTLDDGFAAAVISFGSGLVLVAVLTAAMPSGRRALRRLTEGVRDGGIPWWMLIGGVAGAFNVAIQGLAVGLIGVSLYTVGVVAGQTLSGLILDRVGYGPAGVIAVTLPRLAGGVLALAAVLISFGGAGATAAPLWMLVLPGVVGIAVGWQQATNGRLRARVGSPLVATAVNFLAGTIVLVVAAVIHIAAVGMPEPAPADAWLYLGGAIGAAYIFLSAAVVGYTGVLLLGLGTIVGQLLTSVLIDALWPAASSPGLLQEVVVVIVALGSVVVATIPWRRRRGGGVVTPEAG